MKSKFLIVILFLSVINSTIAQNRITLKGHGISFEEPREWLKTEDDAFRENIQKFQWSDEQKKVLENSKALKLVAFHKYDPKKYYGIIPTINLTIKKTFSKTFEDLKIQLSKNNAALKNHLENFVSSSPKEVQLQNGKAIGYTGSYIITDPNGKKVPLKIHTLDFIKNGYLYNFTFVEEKEKEDNIKIFEDLIKSIELTK